MDEETVAGIGAEAAAAVGDRVGAAAVDVN